VPTVIKNNIVLFIAIVSFLIVKIPHLFLPFSWDEAWSYFPAIIELAKSGPSILPGKISIFFSKGHPLFFYFLNAVWIKIFSFETWVVRTLPLIFSIITIITLYFLGTKYFSKKTANYTVIIFSSQSLFLAQSTLLLPEVLLTLLLLLSFHFFLSNKLGYYAFFASLLVLTKETGLVFAFGFGLFIFIESLKNSWNRKVYKNLFIMTIPLVVFLIHLLLNFISYNTFFFNEHIDLIDLNFDNIRRVVKSSNAILFTMYGRNVISFVAIVSFLFLLFKRKPILNARILILMIFQIIMLLIFTSVNFYTYRYMLPAFPFFILLSVEIFNQTKIKHKLIHYSIVALMIIVPLFYSATKSGKGDKDLGYVQYLPMLKEMVLYCEQQEWDENIFATEFNMLVALRNPITDYLTKDEGYKTQQLPNLENANIVILDSTGEWKTIPENEKPNFKFVKRFERKDNWGEIYIRKQ